MKQKKVLVNSKTEQWNSDKQQQKSKSNEKKK